MLFMIVTLLSLSLFSSFAGLLLLDVFQDQILIFFILAVVLIAVVALLGKRSRRVRRRYEDSDRFRDNLPHVDRGFSYVDPGVFDSSGAGRFSSVGDWGSGSEGNRGEDCGNGSEGDSGGDWGSDSGGDSGGDYGGDSGGDSGGSCGGDS
ncbi:MAG: hypothetical protein L0220_03400 [Acidobacteria bacterium]|nr:hypothetical protein [Acidobacteriota bacterium]